MKLTDLTIKNLPEGYHYDDAIPGFGIRVGKRRKTWLTVQNGHRRTLGHYPALSLAAARKIALRGNFEPLDAPLADLIAAFEARYLPTLSRSVQIEWSRIFQTYLKPLHATPYNNITVRQLTHILEELPPSMANHIVVAWNRLSSWGTQTGRIQNQIKLKKLHKEKARSRVLSLDEIKALWIATATETTFNTIVRLLILTAARRGEIVSNYTLAPNTVTFHNTKNGSDHLLPITAYTHTLLQHRPTTNSWSQPKARLDKKTNLQHYTLHDIRRSVATHMSKELKVDYLTIEAILNHKPQGVRGIYNRDDRMDEMRAALARWEALVLSL